MGRRPFILIKVAVDAMGGDHAPREIVRGAVAALQAEEMLKLILVGRREQIETILGDLSYSAARVEIIHADEVIGGDDNPGLSVRRKKESSLVKALQLVKGGRADAILSAGNTGALMAGALLFLGRLPGVRRPALLTVMPGASGAPFVLIDAGANMDARPEQLLQYAFMGRLYAQKILGRPSPKVALLNVGAEINKGNNLVKKAFPLLQEYVTGFCGNVEGTDVFFDSADVIVCDGFVGNILLKTAEGLGRGLLGRLRQEMMLTVRHRAGAFILQPLLRKLYQELGYAGHGGAPLIGVKGLCIKCHGASRAPSIERAILRQLCPFVELGLEDLFRQSLRDIPRG